MTNNVPHIAVYAGSFDPVTFGHLDVIRRAAKLFDQIHVVVGVSSTKNNLFAREERVAMLRATCAGIANIEIASHSGLTVDFARQVGAKILVRGIRSGVDYTHEMAMAQMNRQLDGNIETVFIPTSSEFFHVSSTLAKDVARHGASLESLVPAEVRVQLQKKLFPQD